jgi:hypothetical protein
MDVETLADLDNSTASSDPAPRANFHQVSPTGYELMMRPEEWEYWKTTGLTRPEPEKPAPIRLNRALRRKMGKALHQRLWGDPAKRHYWLTYPDRRTRMTRPMRSVSIYGAYSPKQVKDMARQARAEAMVRAQLQEEFGFSGVQYG